MIWKVLLIIVAVVILLLAATGLWVFGILFFGNDNENE